MKAEKINRIVKYYTTISKLENIQVCPLKFKKVGKLGACVIYNKINKKPLHIEIDLDKIHDIERAILHEMDHVYLLEKESNPGHNAKFKKKESQLIEKYFYSKYSNKLHNV